VTEETKDCAICACPARREIDILLLSGYKAAEIIETLPECPRDGIMLDAHYYAGHPTADREALTVVAVGVMRDAREAYSIALAKFSNNEKYGPALTKSMELKLRGVAFLAQLHGHLRPDESGDKRPLQITNNQINMAIEADDGLLTRIAETVLEAPKPKVQIRLRKKQDAIETTAKKADARAKEDAAA
jgi:hypothetical protein